jgi:hypothetical protein
VENTTFFSRDLSEPAAGVPTGSPTALQHHDQEREEQDGDQDPEHHADACVKVVEAVEEPTVRQPSDMADAGHAVTLLRRDTPYGGTALQPRLRTIVQWLTSSRRS